MKAQASVEMLLNFLAMLAIISLLIAALSHLLSASKIHDAGMMEKARIEEFARTLDTAESMRLERFTAPPNYSIGEIGGEGVIVREREGQEILGYTIYGIGGNYAEPV